MNAGRDDLGYAIDITVGADAAILAVRAAPERVEPVENCLGITLPGAPAVGRNDRLHCYAIAPDEWMVITSPEREHGLYDGLDAAIGGVGGAVTVTSDAHARLRVSGPDHRAVLRQLVAVDLDAHGSGEWAVRAAFGRVGAVIHQHAGGDTYDIYVDVTFARYAERALLACAGRPVSPGGQ